MVSFGKDNTRWKVFSCDFTILFRLNYGNRNLEYKSLINVQEHWNLKEEIVRDVLECNMMTEHQLQHIAFNAVEKIGHNHCHDDTVPVSIKDIFSHYEYRCLIKFIESKGIEKELIMYDFIENIMTLYHQVVTIVVEIVLPEKRICQKKKLEVGTTSTTIMKLEEKEETPTPAYEKAKCCRI